MLTEGILSEFEMHRLQDFISKQLDGIFNNDDVLAVGENGDYIKRDEYKKDLLKKVNEAEGLKQVFEILNDEMRQIGNLGMVDLKIPALDLAKRFAVLVGNFNQEFNRTIVKEREDGNIAGVVEMFPRNQKK